MKYRLPLAAVLLAVATAGCATDAEMRYPGTVVGESRGVIAPGQTIVSQPQPPVFGTPSNIPEPIRAPTIEQPPFATPVDMDALYGYDGQGRQSLAEGDSGRAEINFERALEVNPFDAVALNNLAVAKAEGGQFYEAMSLLERAAKLAPDNSEVIANLARLRGYVQSYATAGLDADAAASKQFSGTLPPEPPPLWGSYAPVSYQPSYIAPASAPSDYYTSDACRRVPTKRGKVDVVCEPAR